MSKPADRIPLKLPIEYRKSYARSADKGDLKNISISGAFLEHPGSLHVDEKINIHFKVSGRERILQAHVVWNSADGSGVAFSPENNRDVQIVDDLMYFVEMKRSTKKSLFNSILENAITPEG